jgi:alpha-N-acetylglucosaminidase
VRDDFTTAYENKDLQLLTRKGDEMVALMNDMDSLLGSNKNSLVGNWISKAMALGTTPAEKKYFEQDAKKIVTVWGEKGRHLVDYANRSWAGLTKTYYGERWRMFVQQVIADVKNNRPFDEKQFSRRVEDFEEQWAESNAKFPAQPRGNTLAISQTLYRRYSALIEGTDHQ